MNKTWYVYDTAIAGDDYVFSTRFRKVASLVAWILRKITGKAFDYWDSPYDDTPMDKYLVDSDLP